MDITKYIVKGTVTNCLVTPQVNHANSVAANKNDLLVPKFLVSAFRKELMRKAIAKCLIIVRMSHLPLKFTLMYNKTNMPGQRLALQEPFIS